MLTAARVSTKAGGRSPFPTDALSFATARTRAAAPE